MGKLREYMKEQFPLPRRSPDIILLLITLIFVTLGTVMVYGSSAIIAAERFHDSLHFLKKQLLFVVVGVSLMIMLARCEYRRLAKLAFPGIVISIVLLILLFVPPLGVHANGATRWLNIYVISFQVSELVKIAMIVYLAHFFAQKASELHGFTSGILIPLVVAAPILALIVLEPDYGTAAIIMAIVLLMMYLAGSRFVHLLTLGVLTAVPAIWLILHSANRINRLTAFRDPWADPQRWGFALIQSLLSFGAGGTFGVGLGDGMQKLFYLPEPHTDFILAMIGEEMGLLGVLGVIVLFVIFFVRGFRIAFKAPDSFSMLLAAGLTTLIGLEAFVNIAGVMGLIPLKGLALPFLSYGGTALIMNMAAVGILLNISSQEVT